MHNMEQWLSNIIECLRNTDVPQIKYDLAKWDIDDEQLIGKCALGVLSCEFGTTLTPDNVNEIDNYDILVECGVPESLQWDNILPNIHSEWKYNDITNEIEHGTLKISFENNIYSNIDSYIYMLNDSGLTFKEIADFLEVTFGEYDSHITLLDRA